MSQPLQDPAQRAASTARDERSTAGAPARLTAGAGPTSGVRPPESRVGRPASHAARRRHARVVIRKVGPWSVFKMSVIFYLCVMLVFLGAGVVLYAMLGAIGALDSTTRLMRDLFSDRSFEINGRWLFTRALGIGLGLVVVWSLINVFVAFLYNLISDLVGGLEVTLAERR